MSHWNRILYAFALSIAVLLIVGICEILFNLNVVRLFFVDFLFVPLFVVSYFVAPFLTRYIKRR